MRIPQNSSFPGDVTSLLPNTMKNSSAASSFTAILKLNASRISSTVLCSTGMSLEIVEGSNDSAAGTNSSTSATLKGDASSEEKTDSLSFFDFDYFVGHRDAYQYYMANGTNSSTGTNGGGGSNTTYDEELQEMADNVRRLAIPLAVAFFSFLIIFGTFLCRASLRRRREQERQQNMLRACRLRSTRNINLVGRDPHGEITPENSPIIMPVVAAPPLQMLKISRYTDRPLLPCQASSSSQMAGRVAGRELAPVERVQVDLRPLEKAAEYVVLREAKEKQFHARHVAEGKLEPVCYYCKERIRDDDLDVEKAVIEY